MSLLMEFLPRVDITFERSLKKTRLFRKNKQEKVQKNYTRKAYVLKDANSRPEQNMNQLNTIFESLISNHYKDFVEINLNP